MGSYMLRSTIALPFLAVLATTGLPTSSPLPPTANITTLTVAGFRILDKAAPEEAFQCRDCNSCALGTDHAIDTPVRGNGWEGDWHGCGGGSPGTCGENHNVCGELTEDVLNTFEREVTDAAGEQLVQLLAEYADVAFVNLERGAVQVVGCNHMIVSQINLSTSQMAAVKTAAI